MRVTSHLNLQALFCCKILVKNRKFHWRQQEKIVNVYEFFTERNSHVFHRITPFTEHRGGYENDTSSPAVQDAEQKGSSMKLKFLSEDHRDRFLSLFKRLRTNPLRSEPEYCAAIYLLTADPGLWETVIDKVKDESIDFRNIKLGIVDCDRYALYKSAKDILCHKFKMSLAELREMEMLDITIKLIRTAVPIITL